MDLNTLTFWKKPEVVKVVKRKEYPFRKTHVFLGDIKPTTVIKNHCAYEITYISDYLIMDGFAITTQYEDDRIIALNLFGDHPNCDGDSNKFCWPKWKIGLPLNQGSLDMMLTNFNTYYLDNAYFIPPEKHLKYKKIDSIYFQLNRGEAHAKE